MKPDRARLLAALGAALCIATAFGCNEAAAGEKTSRPNILWIIAEDIGPDLACYGNRDARTPHLDRLASEGRLYRRVFSTAPVCSPSRSAFCTGMYQIAFGAQHHRSHRDDNHRLPAGIRLITDRLREAGYFTANVTQFPQGAGFRGTGKTDWNFCIEGKPFDSNQWDDLKNHQPFYAQVNFIETHRIYKKAQDNPTDPTKVTLPPYLPDHPVAREDWALYHDSMMALDAKAGAVLALLEKSGLRENTIVMFFGDNGRECGRGKCWAYEQGCHVPMIIRWPALVAAGSSSDELVSLIDVTATTLALAGVAVPKEMHGRPFLGPGAGRREYVFTARDRLDESLDRVRTVRDARWKYIRNFEPERPYCQTMPYLERTNPIYALMRELHAAGRLTPAQAKFMAPRRAAEELYDLQTDPFELKNLAGLPEHKEVLARLRAVLEAWIEKTNDSGRIPEDPEVRRRILDDHKQKLGKGVPKPK
ncbi:MAG: sulfatase [Verrucomicrobia bacterium]|nr:sulfatase [Verrucomicrobiota bacterium]